MFVCEICNKKADIHHIVHRSEGGFDIQLNYKYLCPVHHRGRLGPHHNLEIDIQYKLELQNKLYKLLRKDYYSSKQLSQILNLSRNTSKRLVKNLKLYKEGYKKDDIILSLMGGTFYNAESLEYLRFQKLLANIY